MKKVFLSAFTFCLLSTAAVFAQDAGQDQPAASQESPAATQESMDQDQSAADVATSMKTEVAVQELPEAVLNSLSGEEFKEWTPTASYVVVDEAETETYSVELQKDEETKSVMFDAHGNEIKNEELEGLEEMKEEGTEGVQETE